MSKTQSGLRKALQTVLREIVDDEQSGYTDRFEQITDVRNMLQDEIADSLEPLFNAWIRASASDTVEAKRNVCSAANEVLRNLGLAIRCPRTSRPTILIADTRNASDHAGRFRLETRDESGRTIRTLTTAKPIPFELMRDEIRIEPFARAFKRRSGPQSR